MNLLKYSKAIKILGLIPVLLGLTHIADFILPDKDITTSVVSKKISTSSKFGNTTYNIYFEDNNDQFTSEIYDALQQNDDVILTTSYLYEETNKITKISSGETFKNQTYEIYARLLMTLVFLLPGLVWFKKYSLSSKQCKWILIIILVSLGGIFRLFKTLF